MHVSAYLFPVAVALPEAFFYREATCWGWATWERAWQHFVADGGVIRDYVTSRGLQYDFNIRDSMDFLGMLERQIAGQVDSWAVRWYGSMFMQSGLALHPGRSLVRNVGFDGSGVHSGATTIFDVAAADAAPVVFPDRIEECRRALDAKVLFRPAVLAPPGPLARLIYRMVRAWL
jgi:hypothetical protein